MTFDIKKHITENNDTLNESSKEAALALGSFVHKLRTSKQDLDKARRLAKKDLGDPGIDRNFSILSKKHLDLIQSTGDMAHAIYKARFQGETK